MLTDERMECLRGWVERKCCCGKLMKAPQGKDDLSAQLVVPQCYKYFYPKRRADASVEAANVAPSILVVPLIDEAQNMEEKRFDRYANVSRPKDLGERQSVQFIFTTYEPGEVKRDGAFTTLEDTGSKGTAALLTWMDELKELLLSNHNVPDSDMYLLYDTIRGGLRTDMNAVMDLRPYYQGILLATFGAKSAEISDPAVDELLNNC